MSPNIEYKPGVCGRCGAMVEATSFNRHMLWHEDLTDALSILKALAEGGKTVPWDAVKRTMEKMAREGGPTHG